MKLPIDWLKDFLNTNATTKAIAATLVNLGIEVERIDDPITQLKDFVVGHVVTCEKHPDANRLSLCSVDYGSGQIAQVVCGAPNVRQGLYGIFAPVGALIPITQQILKKGMIRGVESQGMMCSARELLLSEESDGIIDLPNPLPVGTPAYQALRLSAILDLSITPNRGDCFSIRGLARELSSLGEFIDFNPPDLNTFGECSIKVKIESIQACPFFSCRLIKNVKNITSPDWLRQRLESVGLRSISALVDVTNYICTGLGRPLHVFDADKVKGNLLIRYSKKGENFLALNSEKYQLDDGMIIICDDSGIISLAGIMGGASTACDENTVNVLVESALFNPIDIALAGQKLNLISDARTRFERGVDADIITSALDFSTNIIIDICGGKSSKRVEVGSISVIKEITFDSKLVKKLGGISLPPETIKKYLNNLGIKGDGNKLAIPSWRHDLNIPVDIVEEILRCHGYDNIPSADLNLVQHSNSNTIENFLSNFLSNRGFSEIITWSFVDKKSANLFTDKDLIELENPISQDLSVMRPSLLPSMLKVVQRNQAEERHNCQFFEIGSQFTFPRQENKVLAGIRSGNINERHWQCNSCPVDFFDAKADVLLVLKTMGVSNFQIDASGPGYYHPGKVATIKQGTKILGYVGQIHPKITNAMMAFEIFLDNIISPKKKKNQVFLSPYPISKRDFSFILPRDTQVGPIVTSIKKFNPQLIQEVIVFDIYSGDKIESKLKSVAFEVTLQAIDHTLKDDEIQNISQSIIDLVAKQWHGTLRKDA